MIEVLLIILIIVIAIVGALLALNLVNQKKNQKTTSSKPISLGGLSDTINQPKNNDDTDIIRLLEEKEAEEKLTKDQKEVLKLMTSNREKLQYKTALNKTMEEIRNGGPVKKEGEQVNG